MHTRCSLMLVSFPLWSGEESFTPYYRQAKQYQPMNIYWITRDFVYCSCVVFGHAHRIHMQNPFGFNQLFFSFLSVLLIGIDTSDRWSDFFSSRLLMQNVWRLAYVMGFHSVSLLIKMCKMKTKPTKLTHTQTHRIALNSQETITNHVNFRHSSAMKNHE